VWFLFFFFFFFFFSPLIRFLANWTSDDPTEQVTKLDHPEAKEIFDNSRAALEIAGPGEILTVPN